MQTHTFDIERVWPDMKPVPYGEFYLTVSGCYAQCRASTIGSVLNRNTAEAYDF